MNLKDVTLLQVDYLLENHSVVSVDLHVLAPRFIIPEDVGDPTSPILIVDLGQLRMLSELRTNDPSQPAPRETSIPMAEWQEQLYDKVCVAH